MFIIPPNFNQNINYLNNRTIVVIVVNFIILPQFHHQLNSKRPKNDGTQFIGTSHFNIWQVTCCISFQILFTWYIFFSSAGLGLGMSIKKVYQVKSYVYHT